MALVRYQPRGLLQQFHSDIERLLARDLGGFPSFPGNQWLPAVNIRETDTAWQVEADVPGIDPNDIDITLEQGVLTLSGERQTEKEEDAGQWHHVERSHGRFTRRFRLPDTADADAIEARAANGVLTLEIRKKATDQPRRIEVRS